MTPLDPDPLTVEGPDITDTATQATGWYLVALVGLLLSLGVLACVGAVAYALRVES